MFASVLLLLLPRLVGGDGWFDGDHSAYSAWVIWLSSVLLVLIFLATRIRREVWVSSHHDESIQEVPEIVQPEAPLIAVIDCMLEILFEDRVKANASRSGAESDCDDADAQKRLIDIQLEEKAYDSSSVRDLGEDVVSSDDESPSYEFLDEDEDLPIEVAVDEGLLVKFKWFCEGTDSSPILSARKAQSETIEGSPDDACNDDDARVPLVASADLDVASEVAASFCASFDGDGSSWWDRRSAQDIEWELSDEEDEMPFEVAVDLSDIFNDDHTSVPVILETSPDIADAVNVNMVLDLADENLRFQFTLDASTGHSTDVDYIVESDDELEPSAISSERSGELMFGPCGAWDTPMSRAEKVRLSLLLAEAELRQALKDDLMDAANKKESATSRRLRRSQSLAACFRHAWDFPLSRSEKIQWFHASARGAISALQDAVSPRKGHI